MLSFEQISSDATTVLSRMMTLRPNPITRQPGMDLRLETFLKLSPFVFGNALPLASSVERAILSVLWFSLCGGKEEYFNRLVGPGIPPQSDEPLEYQASQRGKSCGHVFKKGEGVYRCKTCGLDETCVFCSRCFRSTDHDSHDTSFSIASGSGGCCDCGDPEAWRIPQACQYHSALESPILSPESPFPEELKAIMTTVIATCFEFLVLQLASGPEKPEAPLHVQEVLAANPPDPLMQEVEMLYSLCLWNDEIHSFQEVIEVVMEATHCNANSARLVAERVDLVGREIVKTSSTIPPLIEMAHILARNGLAVSIRSARETFKECVVGLIIDWLKTLSKHLLGPLPNSTSQSSERVMREIICQEMCKHVIHTIPQILLPTLNELENEGLLEYHPRIDYLLAFDPRLWKEARNNLRELYVGTFIVSGDEHKKMLGIRFAQNYLTLCRNNILIDREYDISIFNFSVQLFTVPTIAQHLLTQTRLLPLLFVLLKAVYVQDPDVDLETEFLQQVKKCISLRIVWYPNLVGDEESIKNRRFWHIFQDIRFLLSSPQAKEARCLRLSDGPPQHSLKDSELDIFLDTLAVWQGMHPQKRFVQHHVEYEADTWISAFNMSLQISRMISTVCDLYTPIGKSDEIAKLMHALSETRDRLLMAKLKKHTEDVSRSHLQLAKDGFHVVELVPDLGFRVPDTAVSFAEISIHHPVHWFYQSLLEHVPRAFVQIPDLATRSRLASQVFDLVDPATSERRETVDSSTAFTIQDMTKALSSADRVSLLFEASLKTIAFISQIQASIWIRNGVNMHQQATHYRYLTVRECYDRDLFLLQAAIATLGTDKTLTTLADRFEIVPWFQGRPLHSHFDADQTTFLVHDFLTILIHTICERSRANAMHVRDNIRRKIIHHLAVKPSGLTYSELLKRIPDSIIERLSSWPWNSVNPQSKQTTVTFDDILHELSNFKPPDGAADSGLYELKEHLYVEVDPWFWHYSRNAKDQVEEVLKNRLDEKRKSGRANPIELEDEMLRKPSIIALAPGSGFDRLDLIVHSRTFHRIVFFAVWNTTLTVPLAGSLPIKSEAIFGQAIHLCMVAFSIISIQPVDLVISGSNFLNLLVHEQIPVPIDHGRQTRPTTLLELVLSLVDRANEDDIKEHAARLRYIVRQAEELGGETAQRIISGWRDKSRWDFGASLPQIVPMDTSNLDPAKARKDANKARQAAIMAQFAQAQQSFMANFGDEIADLEEEEVHEDVEMDIEDEALPLASERLHPLPAGTCIVCQEETDRSDKPYGMMCHLQPTVLRRPLDFNDAYMLNAVKDTPPTLDRTFDRSNHESHDSQWYNPRPRSTRGSEMYAVSCGHILHFACFQTYFDSVMARHDTQNGRNHPERVSKREFLCPLCKALGNCLLPLACSKRTETVNWFGSKVESHDAVIPSVLDTLLSFNEFAVSNDAFIKQARSNKRLNVEQFSKALYQDEPGNRIDRLNEWNSFRDVYLAYFWRSFTIVDATPFLRSSFVGLSDPALNLVSKLWDLVGNTISGLEIAARGAPHIWHPPHPKSAIAKDLSVVGVFNQFSPLSLASLTILAETALSHLAVQWSINEFELGEFLQDFVTSISGTPDLSCTYPPALLRDGFSHLTVAVMVYIPFKISDSKKDIYVWIRLLWFFEIVRTILSVIEAAHLNGRDWASRLGLSDSIDSEMSNNDTLSRLVSMISVVFGVDELGQILVSSSSLTFIRKLVDSNLVVFGRRVALLLYARLGIVPPSGAVGFGYDMNARPSRDMVLDDDDIERSELDRLREYLGVPLYLDSVDEPTWTLMTERIEKWSTHLKFSNPSLFPKRSIERPLTPSIPGAFPTEGASRWTTPITTTGRPSRANPLINLEFPGILELTSLPKRLDAVFEEALKRNCKNCGTVPHEPALCLICGIFVCSQSYCCAVDAKGECNVHMKTCGGNVGIYLLIKKCAILLLHEETGHFMSPPYLDVHGEVDMGLRRGRPLFLSSRRYDDLRKLWLNLSVPSYVARKMDSIYDFGGWTTL